MKTITTMIIMIISYIGCAVTPIWAIVEFILYLVKDREFNWWSVWTFIISIIVAIVSVTIMASIKSKINIGDFKRKTSKFQERLDLMKKERESK